MSYGIHTQSLHAGQRPDPATGSFEDIRADIDQALKKAAR